ncbi:MAG: hypothetical protein JXA01_09840 [Dehalococcoidia bacterium]|nr:hypothetical protein [Dehalococcoidia bacterium]
MEVVAARTLNYLYIYIDIAWLLIFALILIYRKRYLALIFGVIGGVIYFAVDYGIFYVLLGTRIVTGAETCWFLLWLSISYGFTNIAWIWLLLDRDDKSVEWSALIIIAWLAIALLSQNFGTYFPQVYIQRGTGTYHGAMAVILAVGYSYLIIRNLCVSKGKRVNILWLLVIGIGIQFSWEAVLLVTGIRPIGWMPLIIDSLIETNLGMPYLYLIHKAVSKKYTGDMKKRKNIDGKDNNLLIA